MTTLHAPRLVQFVVAGLVIFLLVFRLGESPPPWFDEGWHLHIPKNLAINGVYADYSSEGTRLGGPTISVGPTVMLPIAALFKFFGVNIPLARSVIVIYALMALWALYRVSMQVSGHWQMSIGAIVLCLMGAGTRFIYSGRNVIGEVPGISFLLLGLMLWFQTKPTDGWRLVGVGILMGLASITKNQFAVFVLPSLLLVWVADMGWYRRLGWRMFVIPGIVAGVIFFGWLLVLFYGLGVAEQIGSLQSTASNAFLVLNPDRLSRNLIYLAANYGLLFWPAAIYGFFLARPRTDTGQRWGILYIFFVLSTLFYITSVGWPRYAFSTLVLATIFVAQMLYKLSSQIDFQKMGSVGGRLRTTLIMILLGIELGVVGVSTYKVADQVITGGNGDVYRMAAYMDEHIPVDAITETWELELAVLTNHTYHTPPYEFMIAANENLKVINYDFNDYVEADYLVTGYRASYANVYPPEVMVDFVSIATFGRYTIWQRQS